MWLAWFDRYSFSKFEKQEEKKKSWLAVEIHNSLNTMSTCVSYITIGSSLLILFGSKCFYQAAPLTPLPATYISRKAL